MKLILITYSAGIDAEVMDILQKCGVESYTKWPNVQGKGKSSGPHLGDHIWPRLNNALAVGVADDKVGSILTAVRELRAKLGSEGVKAFVLGVEEVT